MKKNTCYVFCVLGLILMACPMFGQAVLHVDFLGDQTGQAPSGGIISGASAGNRRVVVVDSSSSPVDPFGGSGNKSLLIEQKNGGAPITARWNIPGASLTSGKVDFSAFSYVNADEGWGLSRGVFYMYDATPDSGNGLAFFMSWAENGRVTVTARDEADSTTNTSFRFDNKWKINEENHVSVEFMPEHGVDVPSFRIWLNGELLTYGQQDYLFLRVGTSKVDDVRFAHDNSQGTNSRIFINEFTVSQIPEPHTVVGVVGVLFGIFLVRKRYVTAKKR